MSYPHFRFPVSRAGISRFCSSGNSTPTKGSKNFKEPSAHVDTDLGHLENSISDLESQLDSLSRVVLPSQRELDLPFMMVLGEACSFYANWSEIIRESLAMVSNDLQEKQNVKSLITSTNLCFPCHSAYGHDWVMTFAPSSQ